jgi:hypothetical protein
MRVGRPEIEGNGLIVHSDLVEGGFRNGRLGTQRSPQDIRTGTYRAQRLESRDRQLQPAMTVSDCSAKPVKRASGRPLPQREEQHDAADGGDCGRRFEPPTE